MYHRVASSASTPSLPPSAYRAARPHTVACETDGVVGCVATLALLLAAVGVLIAIIVGTRVDVVRRDVAALETTQVRVQATHATAASPLAAALAVCPEGTVVIAGGCVCETSEGMGTPVSHHRADAENNGWECICVKPDARATASAVCTGVVEHVGVGVWGRK